MFELIETYIQLLKEERQKHLDFSEPCVEIGGDSREFRGLLAHFVQTTIPKGMKILCCHACNNAKCSNPKHLYWGTPSENLQDAIECGAALSITDMLKERYSFQELGKKGGRIGGKTKGKNNNPSGRNQWSRSSTDRTASS